MGGSFAELPRIAGAPEAAPVAATLDGLSAMQSGQRERALEILRWAWATAGEVQDHPFVRKYISASQVTIGVAEGVSATVPISRDAIGLALAELEQAAGNAEAALAVVEQLDPSTIAAVSLCELYSQAGQHDAVVDLTNGLSNVDDPTALLLAFRGVALREMGLEVGRYFGIDPREPVTLLHRHRNVLLRRARPSEMPMRGVDGFRAASGLWPLPPRDRVPS